MSKQLKPRRRRATRGVLWVVAVMLGLSALLRLGGPVGHAVAGEVMALAEAEPELTGVPAPVPDPNLAILLEQLREREARLADREAALETRLQALAVAEEQISRNLEALTSAEEELAATMALADSAAEEDLTRLTAVYENMKPKEAAPLFEAMDPQFAAGFLARMRPDAAAAVLSGLDPKTAYAISVILAGRNAAVPTN
ncbi:hypothetical protein [Aliiroseovarius sp.]|uniref:MotE family protein n=1 Tax=Aliiroseovarius sp. TaxID=1872442 RepID=UPI00262A51C2|nr:hypothetical protein [Aliiroseovarius sp.]